MLLSLAKIPEQDGTRWECPEIDEKQPQAMLACKGQYEGPYGVFLFAGDELWDVVEHDREPEDHEHRSYEVVKVVVRSWGHGVLLFCWDTFVYVSKKLFCVNDLGQ